MAAGRIVIPGWMPALDSNGAPIPNAQIYIYLNGTTTLATVYSDETLSTPIPNPVEANSSGQFPEIWADDSNLFSISVDAPFGPPGIPFTFDSIGPATVSAVIEVATDAGTAAANAVVATKANKAGDTFTGVMIFNNGIASEVTGLELTRTFVGDGSTSRFHDYTTVIGTSSTQNEIARSLSFDNAAGIISPKAFAVADFTYQINRAGTAAGYTRNDLTDTYGSVATTYELNHNNFGAHSGDLVSQNSIYGAYPWVTMVNAVSAGSKRLLAAFVVGATPSHPQMFNRGYVVSDDSIRLHAFEDASNAQISFRIAGSHTTGIDMQSASVANAMKVPNGAPLVWRNAANTADITGAVLDGGDVFQIGFGTAGIAAGASYNPGANAALDLGSPTARWRRTYTIQVHYGNDPLVFDGSCVGSPNGQITASVGATMRRIDGGAGTTFYVKESGTNTNTGWVAK